MRMRYVIRKERSGAFVFDRDERMVFPLTQEEVMFVLVGSKIKKKARKLPEKLETFFKPTSEKPNFIVRDPLKDLGIIGNENCLAAPNRLYLELTRQCNLRCRMCYNASGQALPNELDAEQFKNILDDMERIGVFEARFTGGEATLRKDFFDILDYAIGKDLYVSLATNGVWNPELTRQICRRKIDDVIVSLEGPEDINDQFRVNGSFQKTLSTIRSLKEAGIRKVRINTVLSRINWRKVEILFQICQEYDLLLIDFIHPQPFGRGGSPQAKDITLIAQEILEFNEMVAGLRRKYPKVKVVMDFDLLSTEEISPHPIVPRVKACPAGRGSAFISPQGYVYPCGVAPVQDINLMNLEERKYFIAGNILENSLIEIWHKAHVWKFYRDLAKCKPSKCFACQYWGSKCFGTCPIGAYYATGKLNGGDPNCYSHLLVSNK